MAEAADVTLTPRMARGREGLLGFPPARRPAMTIALRLAAALAAILSVSAASAQPTPSNYPARQVRIVVPYPAGGPTDVIARLLAQKLGEQLNGTFLVENLLGAS